ncbi:hypothetical protein V8D89_010216, partial [Ganoderma adspersum]
MQFSHAFASLAPFILALGKIDMATSRAATTSASGDEPLAVFEGDKEPVPYLMSHEEMMYWIANTDAELTFIGKPIDPLAPRSATALTTTVTYCSIRVGGVCGGPCMVYTGGGTCLNAPNTNCLGATNNVAFCDRGNCTGDCSQLSTCATGMDNGFCFTPGTESILVFFA